MLHRVISGGQDGVDIAALRAAKQVGLETGGAMPRGFLTASGARPEYAEIYGCVALKSAKYPPRTAQNVADADATFIFAIDPYSAGSRLTAKIARRMGKPLHVYWLLRSTQEGKTVLLIQRGTAEAIEAEPTWTWAPDTWEEVAQLMRTYTSVHIAGNRDASLERIVEPYLVRVFSDLSSS